MDRHTARQRLWLIGENVDTGNGDTHPVVAYYMFGSRLGRRRYVGADWSF